jgi:hypothetical protein
MVREASSRPCLPFTNLVHEKPPRQYLSVLTNDFLFRWNDAPRMDWLGNIRVALEKLTHDRFCVRDQITVGTVGRKHEVGIARPLTKLDKISHAPVLLSAKHITGHRSGSSD